MISSDFFPDILYNSGVGNKFSNYFPRVTEQATNYLTITDDFPDAYYLGWIRPENTPTTFLTSESKSAVYSGEPGKISLKNTTELDNYNIGYLSSREPQYSYWVNYGFIGTKYDTYWRSNDAGINGQSPNLIPKSFPNKFYISSINYRCLEVFYVCLDLNNLSGNDPLTYSIQRINAEDFENWKTQSTAIDFSIDPAHPAVDRYVRTLTVDNNELENNYYQDIVEDDKTYRVLIFTYSAIQDTPVTSNGTSSTFDTAQPFITYRASGSKWDTDHSDELKQIAVCFNNCANHSDDGRIWWTTGINYNCGRLINDGEIQFSPKAVSVAENYILFTNGYIINVPLSTIPEFRTVYFDEENPNANSFTYNNGQNHFTSLVRMFKPSDIIHHMSILPRWKAKASDPATYGVQDGIYYPEVLDTNEFTGRLITGTQAELISVLRPWQIDGDYWSENDYTPDDKPPYEPPSGDDDESGDHIPNQERLYWGASNNFVSQYALTGRELSLFGNRLWTSWADSLGNPTDMWKNFKIFIGGGDTGTVDIGSVMEFIVSLRVYPFDLSSFVGTQEDNIKIGTGSYPISVTAWKLLSTIVYIDCGTVQVPKPFDDFRDYSNMNITAFLPYCGSVQLSAGDVIGRTLKCVYAVDLQTGDCLATIEVLDGNETRYNVASVSGSISALVPISATNSGQLMARRVQDATEKAIMLGNWYTGTVGNVAKGVIGAMGEDVSSLASSVTSQMQNDFGYISGMANHYANRLSRGAIECPSLSGGSGLASFHSPDSPYIQMRYGIYALPDNYNHSVGKISTSSGVIGDYKGTGLIVCENVDVSTLNCHNSEKAVIAAALEAGVFV